MARVFTPYDLTKGITVGQYEAMPEADRQAFDQALVALWVSTNAAEDRRLLQSDYDRIDSNRRSELGD